MSTFRIANPNEQIVGCYVYLLLCRDADDIYIKIGLSETPWNRFRQLASGCGVTPRSFSMIAAPSRPVAHIIEKSLHAAMQKWRNRGEWFRFSHADKSEFNGILHGILALHSTSQCPMRVEKLSASALLTYSKEKKRAGYAVLRALQNQRGKAYCDFREHSGEKLLT